MKPGFPFIIGYILIIPLALGGACLSMLSGVHSASAMEMDQLSKGADISGDHGMVVVKIQDHGTLFGCCRAARMEHDAAATLPSKGKAFIVALVTEPPRETFLPHPINIKSADGPPGHLPLAGITVKRE